jgi:hypothetical protein
MSKRAAKALWFVWRTVAWALLGSGVTVGAYVAGGWENVEAMWIALTVVSIAIGFTVAGIYLHDKATVSDER